jgi:hypothetical protein
MENHQKNNILMGKSTINDHYVSLPEGNNIADQL